MIKPYFVGPFVPMCELFVAKQGYPSYLLLTLPKKVEQHTPYIFSKKELTRVFRRLDTLEKTAFCLSNMLKMIENVSFLCPIR